MKQIRENRTLALTAAFKASFHWPLLVVALPHSLKSGEGLSKVREVVYDLSDGESPLYSGVDRHSLEKSTNKIEHMEDKQIRHKLTRDPLRECFIHINFFKGIHHFEKRLASLVHMTRCIQGFTKILPRSDAETIKTPSGDLFKEDGLY